MALLLDKTHFGVVCNYWKITNVRIDYKAERTIVDLSLYKDASTRTANINNILYRKEFIFAEIEEDRSELYAKIKEPVYVTIDDEEVQANEFVDAEDI